MKKVLCIMGVIFLITCSRKDIPLSPGKDVGKNVGEKEKVLPYVVSAFDFSGNYVFQDLDNDPANGYQDVIRAVFSEKMDKNTINETNVKVYKIANGKIKGTIAGTIDYYEDLKMVEFKPSTGFENSDSINYMLFISSEVKDINGNKLDQNRNGINEGEHFDDYYNPNFRCPASNNIQPDFDPPELFDFYPEYGDNDVSTTPNINIIILGNDLDTSTIEANDIELKEYETKIDITSQVDSIKGFGIGFRIWFSPKNATLKFGKVYELRIKNTIQDSSGNYLDINRDGKQELGEDTIIHFATELENGNPTEFPRVTSATLDQNLKIIKVRFNHEMNTSDFNFSNIKVFKQRFPYPEGFISGIIREDLDKKGFTYSLIEWDGNLPLYLFISYNLRDKDGFKLDGNNDGVGGIIGKDNYWRQF
ncbi:MAG: Ig-like domain-containing protein [candidate division WOR-3 bacterium]